MRTAAEVLRDMSDYLRTPKDQRDKAVFNSLLVETDELIAQEEADREAWRSIAQMHDDNRVHYDSGV